MSCVCHAFASAHCWLVVTCWERAGLLALVCVFGLQTLMAYIFMRWYGLMLLLFVGPTGVYLLDFFCSGIQLYLLLSPYLCFIFFLCLDLYVLEDAALIS